METVIVVSAVIQWVLLIGLALVVLSLARQFGVVLQRLGPPAGALMISKGITLGEPSPEFKLRTLGDKEIQIGGVEPTGRNTLIMFINPDCSVCGKLLPALKSIGVQEASSLNLVFASDGEIEPQRKFWQAKGLEDFPYVLSQELGMTYQIGRLPYGVLLDSKGIMVAQGLCNNREHVESLFEAQRLGVNSIQDFLERDAKNNPLKNEEHV
jgi:methylamine dehydrogenase accessory protein MauD